MLACMEAVFFVVCVFFGVYFICKCINMVNLQRDIIKRLSTLETELKNVAVPSGQAGGISSAYNLADQVSTSLGIIDAGIAVFALFGGILSVYNIMQTKKLETAVRTAHEILETQRELKAARLLQDGRVCVLRGRLPYAKRYFEDTINEGVGTTAALTARYELLLMYAEVLENEAKLKEIEAIFKQLESELNKSEQGWNTHSQLLGDAYLTLGCAYGKCATANGVLDNDKIEKAEEYLKAALGYNRKDIDYHKNLAYTYALTGKKDKCRKALKRAEKYAKQEPLYEVLVSPARLQKLFEPGKDILTPEMKDMLSVTFDVTCL